MWNLFYVPGVRFYPTSVNGSAMSPKFNVNKFALYLYYQYSKVIWLQVLESMVLCVLGLSSPCECLLDCDLYSWVFMVFFFRITGIVSWEPSCWEGAKKHQNGNNAWKIWTIFAAILNFSRLLSPRMCDDWNVSLPANQSRFSSSRI